MKPGRRDTHRARVPGRLAIGSHAGFVPYTYNIGLQSSAELMATTRSASPMLRYVG